MALRAFRANPSLGGFGNENSLGSSDDTNADAFAQIVKELCDNAVDACTARSCSKGGASSIDERRRVRVLFEAVPTEPVLKVTVSDNGCGMKDIEACVAAFSSSKQGSTRRGPDSSSTNPSQTSQKEKSHDSISLSTHSTENMESIESGSQLESQTTGRYGIGLTLCLLHAQSMIENSYALISSTTCSCTKWNKVKYIVDEENDVIQCIEKTVMAKLPGQSGTSVSMLIPGGDIAIKSWPRLAEYFARFQLNSKLECSIEVKAPMLSKVPLFIRSSIEQSQPASLNTMNTEDPTNISMFCDEGKWQDKIDECNLDKYRENVLVSEREEQSDHDKESENISHIRTIQRGAQSYLQCQSIELKNIAHSIHPIRNTISPGTDFHQKDNDFPRLEVDLIVYQTDLDEVTLDSEINSPWNGSMMLIRMVNGVPLLDSVEAKACGLVLGLASMTNTWKSFGLEVTLSNECLGVENSARPANEGNDHQPIVRTNTNSILNIPTFEVKDSTELYKYFRCSAHEKFDFESDDESKDCKKEKKLPAGIRIGKILVVVHIHAVPSQLPLPTLSKSRLPVRDPRINRAFELGIISCLKSIQTTNPDLLFTVSQMKEAERSLKYIPAASASIASIIARSNSIEFQNICVNSITSWSRPHSETNIRPNNAESIGVNQYLHDTKQIGLMIENRFLTLFQEKANISGKKRKRQKNDGNKRFPNEEKNDKISFSSNICDTSVDNSESNDSTTNFSEIKTLDSYMKESNEMDHTLEERLIEDDNSLIEPDNSIKNNIEEEKLNIFNTTLDASEDDDDDQWW